MFLTKWRNCTSGGCLTVQPKETGLCPEQGRSQTHSFLALSSFHCACETKVFLQTGRRVLVPVAHSFTGEGNGGQPGRAFPRGLPSWRVLQFTQHLLMVSLMEVTFLSTQGKKAVWPFCFWSLMGAMKISINQTIPQKGSLEPLEPL